MCILVFFFFSSRRRHTRCALVTGVQTCALPIYWVKPPEDVSVVPIEPNPPGRPGCGQVRRQFDPHCERTDGTVLADSDHGFCRNDRPDYNDVAAGLPDALGYDRTAIETASCNATDHEWVEGEIGRASCRERVCQYV